MGITSGDALSVPCRRGAPWEDGPAREAGQLLTVRPGERTDGQADAS